jgi:hypothetical protein
MHKVTIMAALVFALPAIAGAQGRGRDARQGIPPGHLPPPGECRVWYDGRPPGQQPPPTDCRTAEARARRDNARVIYGDDRTYSTVPWYGEDRNRGGNRDRDRYEDRRGRDDRRPQPGAVRGRDRAVPRGTYPEAREDRYQSGRYESRVGDHPAGDAGYRDGLEKGREDTLRNRSYDPHRHQWYRSATRGYDRRYGSKDEYVNAYRRAFTAGYDQAFGR